MPARSSLTKNLPRPRLAPRNAGNRPWEGQSDQETGFADVLRIEKCQRISRDDAKAILRLSLGRNIPAYLNLLRLLEQLFPEER